MRQRLTLTEGDDTHSAHLGETEAAALAATGLAKPQRTAVAGEWNLVTGRKVGTITIGRDLQVTVNPKVSIDRLVFMMSYARHPTFWRDEPVTLAQHDELPEALARTFQRYATNALEQGLLHGYKTVDDSLHVVRGRIRTDDQLRLRFQMPLPAEVRYDDFSTNIAENRILLTTVLQLLHIPQLSTQLRTALHRLRLQLNDVEPFRRGTPPPTWQPTRLNARYEPALRVAELILAATSFEQEHASVEVDVHGFVFDAWKIFEDFVCVALGEALAGLPGRAALQHRDHLDINGRIPIEPDFTWYEGNHATIVVDAKYKTDKSTHFPNADTYQVLAYCTALGLQDGHLVYAKGEGQHQTHRIMRSPIHIHCHTLDLTQNPGGLLNQVRALAALISDTRNLRLPVTS